MEADVRFADAGGLHEDRGPMTTRIFFDAYHVKTEPAVELGSLKIMAINGA